MKVLIACEFSGIVRNAFAQQGHDAWSCDLLPTELPGNHLQCNVLEILNDGWDLMIAHPPCTYLTCRAQSHNIRLNRWEQRKHAINFFMVFANHYCKKICIENPLGIMNTLYRKPDQIIHPYYFGEREMKKTCLWLKGLPKLVHVNVDDLFHSRTHTDKPQPDFTDHKQKRYFIDRLPPSAERVKIRSRTFRGIAEAMAQQWGQTNKTMIHEPTI